MIPSAPPPDLPESNLDALLPEVFANAKWFISQYQAYVMVGTAIMLAFTLLTIIVNLFDRSKDDDDDDGFDYKEI